MKTEYLIIGAGKLARHFAFYFDLLQISYLQWSRCNDPEITELPKLINNSEKILILIADSAIESFIQKNIATKNKILIHCSGSLVTTLAHSAHLLMTFGNKLYDAELYLKIPFVLEKEGEKFENLFPKLPNPHFYIPRNLKPLYHSLCVLSGNFTCILWQKFFHELESTLKLPKEIAYQYLQQTLINTANDPTNALTGPLIRNDQNTIAANLKALENDPYQKIYLTFVEIFQNKKVQNEYQ